MTLMPKQNIFFELFEGTQKDLSNLSALFSSFAEKFSNYKDYAERAHGIERNADEKTHRIIEELNSSFITPFDREDVYLLAHELDDIVDILEDAIRSVYLYNVKEKIPAASKFAKLIAKDAEYLGVMVRVLAEMKRTPELQEAKIRMHDIEDQGDIIFEEAISELFRTEKDATELVKIKDILEKLENVLDKFQEVSDLIEGIVIKSS